MKGGPFVLVLLVAIVAACSGAADGAPTPSVAPASPVVATSGPTAFPSLPAASGAATSRAVITDRYPDGLPRTIDGAPVLRGAAALANAKAVGDDTPFLVAGWLSWVPGARFCPLFDDGSTWLRDCGRPAISDLAGAQDPALTAAITFRFVLDRVSTGPIVARVRVHDPRASTCGSDMAQCDRMMVVLGIAWAGDDATAPRPLSVDAVELALRSLNVSADIVPRGSELSESCGNDLAGADVSFLAAPERVWPLVTAIEIEPSVAARQRALVVPTGAPGSLTGSALVSTAFSRTPSGSWSEECRWLAISNVALVVRTHHSPTAADRAFLDRLAAALDSAAASGG
jgi:hypothetical protein